MINPHVHVPFQRIEDYLKFIRANRLNLEIYFSSQSLDSINDSDIVRLKEKLDYGPSFSIHAPFMDLSPGAVDSKARKITIERFLHIFDIAEILRPRSVVFHSGYEKWKYALKVDIWLENSLKTWKVFTDRALKLNLKIVIENVFEEDTNNLRLLMEAIGSEYLGICFDTGHFNLFSKIPLSEWLTQLKPYIYELHLHDNNKTSDQHIAIGDGTFDFDTLFSILKGKELIYTVEGHTPEDVLKSVRILESYL